MKVTNTNYIEGILKNYSVASGTRWTFKIFSKSLLEIHYEQTLNIEIIP